MKTIVTFALIFTLACSICRAETVAGRCVTVIDGDNIDVMIGSAVVRVRLFGIDAPELEQAFGQQARASLSGAILGKDVVVEIPSSYNGELGLVSYNGKDINGGLVRIGLAWCDRSNGTYSQLQEEARYAKRGLWSNPNPIPPWDFRAGVRSTPIATPLATRAMAHSGQIVYITNTGNMYHLRGCRYLRQSVTPIDLADARRKGYAPCSVCTMGAEPKPESRMTSTKTAPNDAAGFGSARTSMMRPTPTRTPTPRTLVARTPRPTPTPSLTPVMRTATRTSAGPALRPTPRMMQRQTATKPIRPTGALTPKPQIQRAPNNMRRTQSNRLR